MSLADELQKLEQLKISGALTEDEYQQAKSVALSSARSGDFWAKAVNFWKRPGSWAALIHLSVFAGYAVPIAGFVAPLLLWQVRKDDPFIDAHGRIVMNAIFSFLIWAVVSLVLVFFVVGVAMLWGLGILVVVLPLVGAVRAFQGKVWEYPATFTFFRVPPLPESGEP